MGNSRVAETFYAFVWDLNFNIYVWLDTPSISPLNTMRTFQLLIVIPKL